MKSKLIRCGGIALAALAFIVPALALGIVIVVVMRPFGVIVHGG